ncbi:acyltransferase [Devosia pacifica]|uniref:Acyltransferase n=1 Tax=Devosia pacifica TaxID=1335967 RepID=A0A918SCA3_9HYPH|nr:acyltransferase [Devosia pacifica]GHA35163.1 acyltransferase [Devosia pacifica]
MSGQRVETIDIFRGAAILMVVLFHFTARLPDQTLHIGAGGPLPVTFGWIGVYFFFIVSGYCIFMTLERSQSVGVFLARRFSRLYPAFAAAVILLFVFQIVFAVPSVPEAHFREVAPSGVDLILNLMFLGELGEWVNGSFWSIAVEIKFYLLVALLWAFIPDASRFSRVFGLLGLLSAPVWMASTVISGPGTITPQSMLKFLLIAPYVPFFAVGILGQRLKSGSTEVWPLMLANLLMCLGVIWVSAGGTEAEQAVWGQIITTAVFGVLVALFVVFSMGVRFPVLPGFSGAVAKLGLLSYSWYLIHETIGVTLLANLNLSMPAGVSLAETILATIGIAAVFSYLFEWRFRKGFERAAGAILDWVADRSSALAPLRTRAPATPAE